MSDSVSVYSNGRCVYCVMPYDLEQVNILFVSSCWQKDMTVHETILNIKGAFKKGVFLLGILESKALKKV